MATNQSGRDLPWHEAAGPCNAELGDRQLKAEFDDWARDGRADKLESDHLYVTEQAMLLMDLKPGDRALDLSCGSGWATRLLAQRVSDDHKSGQAVGVDISAEMVALASRLSRSFSNIDFVQAPADSIPLPSARFDRILSVEAFYYYPDQERALDEMYRLLAPGGRLFILINIYKDNPSCEYWTSHLPVNAHFRSAAEYVQLIQSRGFSDVSATQIPNKWQPEGGYVGAVRRVLHLLQSPPNTWPTKLSHRFRRAKELHDARSAGALLLTATKPGHVTPSEHD